MYIHDKAIASGGLRLQAPDVVSFSVTESAWCSAHVACMQNKMDCQ